jgi:ribosomal-protein-alanine N-acetyltransferase
MRDNAFPVLRTERLCLRAPAYEDVLPLLRISQDEEVMRYYGVEAYETELEARREVDWMRRIFEEDEGIRWVIALRDHPGYIGDVGLDKYSKKHSRAELGFKLRKEYWRRGIMTEALTEVLSYGFEAIGLNRIEALVDPRNEASSKLLERNGFRKEGVLREYEFEKGEFIDLTMMSLLKREWKVS